MTLAVAEALNPNTPNLDMTLAVAEALNPNKPNLDMTLAVAEALNPNTPNQPFGHVLKRTDLNTCQLNRRHPIPRVQGVGALKEVADTNIDWNLGAV